MFNSNGSSSDVKLGVKIIIFGAVFTLIAIFAVILRIWSRHLKRQELALNDWAAIAALVCRITEEKFCFHREGKALC